MNRCLTSFEAKLALEQLCDLTSIRKANVNSSVFSLTSSKEKVSHLKEQSSQSQPRFQQPKPNFHQAHFQPPVYQNYEQTWYYGRSDSSTTSAIFTTRTIFTTCTNYSNNFMYCSFDGIDSRFYFLKIRFGILVEMDRTSYLTQSDDLCNKQKILVAQ